MAKVFHTRLYGKFIEIKNNNRRKKLHRKNPGFNFCGGSFALPENVQIRSFFLSVFSCIRIEYGDLLRRSPYSDGMQENKD